MAVDPALLSLTKPIEDFTPWPRPKCPNCDTGHVNFAQPTEVESAKSEARHSHPDFEPDWISGTFSIVGQCDNPQCQQNVHGSGDYQVAYTVDSFPPDARVSRRALRRVLQPRTPASPAPADVHS